MPDNRINVVVTGGSSKGLSKEGSHFEVHTIIITRDVSYVDETFAPNKQKPHGWYRKFDKRSVFKRR
jgi:hypothetical protein